VEPQFVPQDPRRVAFDVLKGIGILEVILHHCLGASSRKYVEEAGAAWWVMRGLNRLLHFAIPLFLLVSAVLLTQSLMRRYDWGRFVKRRAARTLWPYLLWSAIYWLFRLNVLKVGSDVVVASYSYPLLGTLTGPNMLVDLQGLSKDLIWGKAYFHLYFMVVLLQMAVLLPLVVYVVRKGRFSFSGAFAAAAALQLIVYLVQANLWRISTPASMVLWYMAPLFLGVWIGMHPERWSEVWRRCRGWFLLAAGLALAVYLPASLILVGGGKVPSLLFNSAFSAYAVLISLVLLGFSTRIARSRLGPFLAMFGRVSLPMFLVHPIVLYFLSGPKISSVIEQFPAPVVLLAGLVIAISYGLARLASTLRMDVTFFGQRLPVGHAPSARATSTAG